MSFFSWKKNKQFANCLKIPREIFKSGEELPTTDKNASTWLKKLDSVSPQVFVKENCLFFGEWLSSKRFFRPWVDVFRSLAKKLQQIVKIVCLSVQINIFRRKIFAGKRNSCIKFQTSSGVFIKSLVKEMHFRQRNISTVVKTELYASRETFWRKWCFPKENQLEKSFVLWVEFYFLL